MIKSMTGYGGAKGVLRGKSVTVELKSVNNRYLDCSVRLPRSFLFAEDAIKTQVQGRVSRGKVDVFVSVDNAEGEDAEVRLNQPLLESYLAAMNEMCEKFGLRNDVTVSTAARLPDVLSVERRDVDADEALAVLSEILDRALNDYDAMREREGERLRADLLSRITEIDRLTGIVERETPATVEAYRQRLELKLRETLADRSLDESRIVMEAAVFADKVAVDEETVRLRSHLSQLGGMLNGDSPVGRKMDFLMQELNREANTIGSKCMNADIAHVVVDLKAELEKIREQIANVE